MDEKWLDEEAYLDEIEEEEERIILYLLISHA